MRLNIFQATHKHQNENDLYHIDIIDEVVEEFNTIILDPLETSFFDQNFEEEAFSLTHSNNLSQKWTPRFESLPEPIKPAPPSLLSPPELELKPLPSTLKYVFLGPNDTLPVIIASDLTQTKETQLTILLQKYKGAIGWSVSDLKGLDPSICMHYIHTDDGVKPVRDMQRRLNPNMKEVVKKEIIKWLDSGIIYPISDSPWVSPTQVVPKKIWSHHCSQQPW